MILYLISCEGAKNKGMWIYPGLLLAFENYCYASNIKKTCAHKLNNNNM